MESKGGGPWDAALGGVGIVHRPGMILRAANKRPHDDEAQALWHSIGQVHSHMAYA